MATLLTWRVAHPSDSAFGKGGALDCRLLSSLAPFYFGSRSDVQVRTLMSVTPFRFLCMASNIYQVKYCSVIIRLVQASRTMGAAV